MRVFTCKGFCGHWPVGTSAVIVAESTEHAERLLREQLAKDGLPQGDAGRLEIVEVDIEEPKAVVLNNGDY